MIYSNDPFEMKPGESRKSIGVTEDELSKYIDK